MDTHCLKLVSISTTTIILAAILFLITNNSFFKPVFYGIACWSSILVITTGISFFLLTKGSSGQKVNNLSFKLGVLFFVKIFLGGGSVFLGVGILKIDPLLFVVGAIVAQTIFAKVSMYILRAAGDSQDIKQSHEETLSSKKNLG